jgi:calcium-dependent protein kinase
MQMAPKNKEYLICRELDHPNIANVYEMFVQDFKLDIVSEYLEGGELNEYLNSRNYDEIQAAKYIYQTSSALIYLNNHNITHRDIKPQNILFENREPDSPLKLIDFDLCGKNIASDFMSKSEHYHLRRLKCWRVTTTESVIFGVWALYYT